MVEAVTGEDIIVAIVEHMCGSLEPLLYTTRAPGLYRVYLGRHDYDRLKGLFPAIIDEAKMALDQKLALLNDQTRSSSPLKKLPFIKKGPERKYLKPEGGWNISFSLEEDLEEAGNYRIEALMVAPAKPIFGSGSKTIRVGNPPDADLNITRRDPDTRREPSVSPTPMREPARDSSPAEHIFARFTYEDESGKQTYLMKKSQISIGRGGVDYWVDLKFNTKTDVSHEHAHVRYDETTDKFYIKDLSTFGTSINETAIPSSMEAAHGSKRDKNLWVSLPPKARIGLADVLSIEFEAAKK